MTTSEPDGTPTTPKPTRRRRTPAATAAPDVLPVGRSADEPAAAPPEIPPEIEEDGAWIEADAVEVDRSVIGRVDATDVAVTRGVIGAARADRVSLEMGVLGAAFGREVSVSQGAATTILAQNVRVEQAFIRTMVAQEVTIHRPSAVLFLIAQRVSGDVKVLLDWRGAVAFGAVFGILAGLFGRGRGRRRDRG
jgi:hypothetical protein